MSKPDRVCKGCSLLEGARCVCCKRWLCKHYSTPTRKGGVMCRWCNRPSGVKSKLGSALKRVALGLAIAASAACGGSEFETLDWPGKVYRHEADNEKPTDPLPIAACMIPVRVNGSDRTEGFLWGFSLLDPEVSECWAANGTPVLVHRQFEIGGDGYPLRSWISFPGP